MKPLGGTRAMHAVALTIPSLAALALSGLGQRGWNLWSVWLVEHAERVTAARAAPPEQARELLAQAPLLFPLPGAVASALAPGNEAAALAALAALACGATVFAVSWLASRVGGVWAGVVAGVALLLSPPFLAAATVPGPTLFSAAALAALLVGREWSRDHALSGWGLTVAALFCALYSGLPGWLWLAPLFVSLFVSTERVPGQVVIRPTTPADLLAIPLAIVAGMLILPGPVSEGADGLGHQLRGWLQVPSEPLLYRGHLYGTERAPLLAAPLLLVGRTPLALVVLTGVGVISTWRDARLRTLRHLTLAALALPFLLATPYSGGHDLLAIALVPLAVFAGLGAASLIGGATRRARRGARGVITAACLVAALSLMHAAPHWESYASGVLRGAEGAARQGFARAWRAPVPAELFETLPSAADRAVRVHVPINAWELRPVLERYVREGVVPPLEFVDRGRAEFLVVKWEDGAAEMYPRTVEMLSLRADGRRFAHVEVQGVPLFEIFDVRR